MTPTTQENAPTAKPIQKFVPLSRITEDHSLQVRGSLTLSRVREMESFYAENGPFDPLDLFYQDPINAETKFYVADGFHRLAAYRSKGVEKIPCNLRQGSHADAVKFALRKNGHHGTPMTNPEKRAAAAIAVLDPEIAMLTDVAIARMIGCSASLVASARRGESPQAATAAKKAPGKKRAAKAKEEPPKAKEPETKRETETSGNPREVTVRERHPAADGRPTKAALLKQISDYLTTDVLDEIDLLKLMDGKDGEWRWVKKPGDVATLRIIGSNGREQIAIETVVKEIQYDCITLKYEKGKVSATEKGE